MLRCEAAHPSPRSAALRSRTFTPRPHGPLLTPPPPRGLRLSALQEPVLSILSHRPYGFTPYNEWTQQSCEPEPSRVAPARPARRDRSAERC